MSRIKDFKKELVDIIYQSLPNTIPVLLKLFPGNSESLNELKTIAKGEGKAVVYITYAGRRYGEKKGGAYHPYESFSIFIFSKVYNDNEEQQEDIEVLTELVTDALYYSGKNYDIHGHVMNPVFTQNKDFFMAVLEIGKFLPVYPY